MRIFDSVWLQDTLGSDYVSLFIILGQSCNWNVIFNLIFMSVTRHSLDDLLQKLETILYPRRSNFTCATSVYGFYLFIYLVCVFVWKRVGGGAGIEFTIYGLEFQVEVHLSSCSKNAAWMYLLKMLAHFDKETNKLVTW